MKFIDWKSQRSDDKHGYSLIQLNDLPDEILLIIFKKLNNIELLYSLINVNKRVKKIVRCWKCKIWANFFSWLFLHGWIELVKLYEKIYFKIFFIDLFTKKKAKYLDNLIMYKIASFEKTCLAFSWSFSNNSKNIILLISIKNWV